MRRRLIMIALAAGTVLGFGSGIRHVMGHHDHGCHRGDRDRDWDRDRDRDRGRDRDRDRDRDREADQ